MTTILVMEREKEQTEIHLRKVVKLSKSAQNHIKIINERKQTELHVIIKQAAKRWAKELLK